MRDGIGHYVDAAHRNAAPRVKRRARAQVPLALTAPVSFAPASSRVGCTVQEDPNELKTVDSEGRCVVTDHGAFVLFNVYCPNAGGGEDRYDYKLRFNRLLQARCERAWRRPCGTILGHAHPCRLTAWRRTRGGGRQALALCGPSASSLLVLLAAGRQVVIAGDVNIAHREIDTSDPERSMRQCGLTEFGAREDRQWCGGRRAPTGVISPGAGRLSRSKESPARAVLAGVRRTG